MHGYARRPDRAAQASDLQAATRMSLLMHLSGALTIAAGIAGLFFIG